MNSRDLIITEYDVIWKGFSIKQVGFGCYHEFSGGK